MVFEKSSRPSAATIISALVTLAIILTAGLWPFHAPANDVSWLGTAPGLRFGTYGSILTEAPFPLTEPTREHSLEIWLEAGDLSDENTFLTFYRPASALRLALRQVGGGVNIDQCPLGTRIGRCSHLSLAGVFRSSRPAFISVVAEATGTKVYVDGKLSRTDSGFRCRSDEFAGILLIGDSPFHSDSWSGRLLGVGVYDVALTSTEVSRDWENWTSDADPDFTGMRPPIALYLFNEKQGSIVRSRIPGAPPLIIPTHYTIIDETLLDPIWAEFNFGWGYWKNALINIGGFIPLGFVFLTCCPVNRINIRTELLVVGLGFLVSLTIEVLQGFLPTRQSGTTDLITNTLGMATGVVLYRYFFVHLARWLRFSSGG